MSRWVRCFEIWLPRVRAHLAEQRYGKCATRHYPSAMRRFCRNLERRGESLTDVTPADVDGYVGRLRRQRSKRPFPAQLRRFHRAAIHMLLRLVHGTWPPAPTPTTSLERDVADTVAAFDVWMRDLRGLADATRRHRRAEAQWLLTWLGGRGTPLDQLTTADLDAYLAERIALQSRRSAAQTAATLRAVLRYFHNSGRMPVDLSRLVNGPTVYALERLPSMIAPEHVRRVLAVLKQDHTPTGRRDYAIWVLLTTYGLRAGEVRALTLADVDWRHERLHIRHAKTGVSTELPLLPGPASALLAYLRHGRPPTADRTVFLRAQAPYVGLQDATSLHGIVTRGLAAAGIEVTGKRGPHALRHSRAVSLLRGGVPLKVIGDVLGHRSERSTATYLRLATEDLRRVALPVPQGAMP
jgi:site-specific recombinase XerD